MHAVETTRRRPAYVAVRAVRIWREVLGEAEVQQAGDLGGIHLHRFLRANKLQPHGREMRWSTDVIIHTDLYIRRLHERLESDESCFSRIAYRVRVYSELPIAHSLSRCSDC